MTNSEKACVASVPVGFPCRFRRFGRAKIKGRPKKERGGEEKTKPFPFQLEGLGEFSTVMQTLDFVSGLHNCLEFSQALSCLYQAMQTRKRFLLLKCMIRVNGRSNLGLLAGMMNP